MTGYLWEERAKKSSTVIGAFRSKSSRWGTYPIRGGPLPHGEIPDFERVMEGRGRHLVPSASVSVCRFRRMTSSYVVGAADPVDTGSSKRTGTPASPAALS